MFALISLQQAESEKSLVILPSRTSSFLCVLEYKHVTAWKLESVCSKTKCIGYQQEESQLMSVVVDGKFGVFK